MWPFRRTTKQHRVAVYDTRPLPDDSKAFDPYFIAMCDCDCDWVGVARDSSEEAFADAREHDANVAGEIVRPLG